MDITGTAGMIITGGIATTITTVHIIVAMIAEGTTTLINTRVETGTGVIMVAGPSRETTAQWTSIATMDHYGTKADLPAVTGAWIETAIAIMARMAGFPVVHPYLGQEVEQVVIQRPLPGRFPILRGVVTPDEVWKFEAARPVSRVLLKWNPENLKSACRQQYA